MNCETTVAALFRKILKNVPCFEEITSCTDGCPTKKKKFPTLSVDITSIIGAEPNSKIEADITMPIGRKCSTEGCTVTVKSDLKVSGNFIALEINENEDIDSIRLKDITESIKLEIMDEELPLRGAVHFDSPPMPRRYDASVRQIGHYTAYCYRNRGADSVRPEGKKNGDAKISPSLVIYAK